MIVGRDCRIGAHVSLSYAVLGARVYVYPAARIGQEGFGFASIKDGFLSVPQLGRVILGSVEIQDSQIRKSVIQAPKGVWHAPIRFDRRPVGEDGAALFG